MRTLIAGGGTGGHLTPALALAQALARADSANDTMLVTRRGGVGEVLLRDEGQRVETLNVQGLDLSRPLAAVGALARLPLAVLQAAGLIRRFRPSVVVGTAGYVCVPVVVAAFVMRVPVVLLEQNVHPGRAIRLLARRAAVVAAAFAETSEWLPSARVVHTGNPLREALRAAGAAPLGDVPSTVLITGGSQGAVRLNRAVAGCVASLLARYPGLKITHQCGAVGEGEARAAAATLPDSLRDRYQVEPFFQDLTDRMRAADLVIMRAGGSSLAECAALGRPMILVPYPHAGGHQLDNARPYVAAGAALLLEDAACTPQRLERDIDTLLGDAQRWRAMAQASAACGRLDAADRVVALVHEVAA